MTTRMRVLLVVPYFGGSHRAWAEGYRRHSNQHVDLLTLPARFWKWRMQGGAATLAAELRSRLESRQAACPDVLVATDMVNLPAFLGLAKGLGDCRLVDVPVVLYCHENQLTYPVPPSEKRDLTYAMINWLSMLAADRVVFNSAYHQRDWFAALPNLLKHFPDCSHLSLLPAVRAKSAVLPVGLDVKRLETVHPRMKGRSGRREPPLILWNQRWEYDKNPKTFFRAIEAVADAGIDFRLALAGVSVRQNAAEFEAARGRLAGRIVHYGRASRAKYRQLLWQADIVVSTAIHEFFGVAVAEAIICQTFPVLPNRLAYPELLPPEAHALCLYESFEALVERLSWALTHRAETTRVATLLRRALSRLDWQCVARDYDTLVSTLAQETRGSVKDKETSSS